MIQVQDIVKLFGKKQVLDHLSFSVQRGESVALLGSNGAGKTTLIRIMATLARPSSGQFTIAGYSSKKEAHYIRQSVGIMSHFSFLYPDLTAEENLHFFGRMYGVKDLTLRTDLLLEQVGLVNRRFDRVSTFSRGMQQRLSLARALLHDPPALLLDEPFAGLDIQAQTMLKELLFSLITKHTTVLLAMHDLEYALENAQRIFVLKRGQFAIDQSAKHLSKNELNSILTEP